MDVKKNDDNQGNNSKYADYKNLIQPGILSISKKTDDTIKFSGNIEKIDENNKKKEYLLLLTRNSFSFFDVDHKLKRRIPYNKLFAIIYSLMGNQFVLQIKSEADIRLISPSL